MSECLFYTGTIIKRKKKAVCLKMSSVLYKVKTKATGNYSIQFNKFAH